MSEEGAISEEASDSVIKVFRGKCACQGRHAQAYRDVFTASFRGIPLSQNPTSGRVIKSYPHFRVAYIRQRITDYG